MALENEAPDELWWLVANRLDEVESDELVDKEQAPPPPLPPPPYLEPPLHDDWGGGVTGVMPIELLLDKCRRILARSGYSIVVLELMVGDDDLKCAAEHDWSGGVGVCGCRSVGVGVTDWFLRPGRVNCCCLPPLPLPSC